MAARTYLRDGRAPVPVDARVSEQMSRIRGKNTKPERAMRAALRAVGLRGYRLNFAKVPGKPDIAFVGKKVAVFVHGCFWHGCPRCQPPRPRINMDYWDRKLDRNIQRDRQKARALRKAGWSVITVWECRLKKDPEGQAARVLRTMAGRA